MVEQIMIDIQSAFDITNRLLQLNKPSLRAPNAFLLTVIDYFTNTGPLLKIVIIFLPRVNQGQPPSPHLIAVLPTS